MDSIDNSSQPIVDAIGQGVDPSTLAVQFTPNSAAVDNALSGGSSLSLAGITNSLSAIPVWAWLAIGAVIVFKVAR